jgi:hypothetical protein
MLNVKRLSTQAHRVNTERAEYHAECLKYESDSHSPCAGQNQRRGARINAAGRPFGQSVRSRLEYRYGKADE